MSVIRQRLIDLIYPSGWPATMLPAVAPGISPITAVPNLGSVEKFTIGQSYAYRLIPAANTANKLAIIHQGHANAYDDLGLGRAVNALIQRGWEILLVAMPGRTGNGGDPSHGNYTSLAPFVDQVVAALNHLDASSYDDVVMTGVSGGGWAATLCPAIDPRIRASVAVSGSLPKDLRGSGGGSQGDFEQQAVYSACDYTALYALAADAPDRRHRQVLNPTDSCCFGKTGTNGAYGDDYGVVVQGIADTLEVMGAGRFDWMEDVTIPNSHEFSQWAVDNALIPIVDVTAPELLIIDNDETGFQLTGPVGNPNQSGQTAWTRWDNGGYGGSYYAGPNTIGLSAEWSFEAAPATYIVEVSFYRHGNRATNATYAIYDGPTLLQTVTVSQNGPTGVVWVPIGTVTTTNPVNQLRVVISNPGADGFVIADAARIGAI